MRHVFFASVFALAAVGCKARSFNTTQSAGNSVTLGGVYTSNSGSRIHIFADAIAIVTPDGSRMQGTLMRDGTLGASYNVKFPEGYVCGGYSLSLWVAEGQMGDGSTLKLTWQKPDGSVAKQCGSAAKAEGSYTRQAVSLIGNYSSKNGQTLAIQDGKAIFRQSETQQVVGNLERDGTAGGSYTIRFPEGFVCGTYQLSLWVAEGQMGDGSQFKLKWNKPDGTVVKSCGDFAKNEGEYKRASQFGGVYFNDKQTKIMVTGDRAEFTFAGSKKFEGRLEREGTMGASYTVRFPEGFVCGSYRLSLWRSEGNMGDGSAFKATWIAPEGSVRQSCTDMPKGEGQFLR